MQGVVGQEVRGRDGVGGRDGEAKAGGGCFSGGPRGQLLMN
jgi:hypothetical protein